MCIITIDYIITVHLEMFFKKTTLQKLLSLKATKKKKTFTFFCVEIKTEIIREIKNKTEQ